MNDVEFVLESVGTRGDITPLLALGTRLIAAGHECRLIAPRAFRAEAEAQGLVFHASTDRREAATGVQGTRISDFYHPAFDAVAAAMADLARPKRMTVVVNIDRSCSSNLIAEKLSLPTLRLTLCPFKVRSLVAPPWPWAKHAHGAMGKVYLKHTYPRLLERLGS